jgi:hypothetical protein
MLPLVGFLQPTTNCIIPQNVAPHFNQLYGHLQANLAHETKIKI